MILCEKPYPTIKNILENIQPPRAFDYVSYRLYLGEPDTFTKTSEHEFAGYFATNKANDIISLNHDTYDINKKVLAYEEWIDTKNHVYNGLTLIVACK